VVHLTDFGFGFRPHVGPRSREKLGTRPLSDARKHRQAGAQKATAKRKGKSFKKPGKAPLDSSELWCICGGPECGDVIACEHKDCPVEWFHFQRVGLSTAPSGEWFSSVNSARVWPWGIHLRRRSLYKRV